jgi:hypothetical protein
LLFFSVASLSLSLTTSTSGSTLTVLYRDETSQQIRVSELSDTRHFITWDLVDSTPSVRFDFSLHSVSFICPSSLLSSSQQVKYTSATHTISLLEVTESNTT